MNPGGDESPHGREHPPLEDTESAVDPYAPVDYPTDTPVPVPPYPAAPGFAQPGAPDPGYAPPGYPQPGYPQPGYPPPGYPPPGYPQMGYPPPGSPPPGYPPPYPGGYPYAYDPYAQAPPAGTNGKAIAALVTSLAGLLLCGLPSIVGMILGIIALRETRETGQDGHGLALAGVLVGALAIAGWLLYVVVMVVFALAVSSSPSYY